MTDRAEGLEGLSAAAPRFLRRLPLAALAAFLAWIALLAPLQGRLVSGLAETLVRLCERPALTFFREAGDRVEVSRADLPESGGAVVALSPITMNLALYLALVWATPRALSRGLLAVLLGVAAILAFEVIHLALTVGSWYATSLGAWSLERYPRLQRELLGTTRYLFDVLLKLAAPVGIWLLTLTTAEGRAGEKAGGGRAPRKR